jgi:hypothetical protein
MCHTGSSNALFLGKKCHIYNAVTLKAKDGSDALFKLKTMIFKNYIKFFLKKYCAI